MHLLSAIGAKLRVAGLAGLPLGSRFAGTLLFQRPSEERLDYGLATDIGPGRTFVKFPQHALGQIDVHATDGPDHRELVGETSGNILAARREGYR
jgi:hypothetical protein